MAFLTLLLTTSWLQYFTTSHRIKNKQTNHGVNNHRDNILLNLWKTFTSYFEIIEEKFTTAKDQMSSSTKKEYLPSPTMPLLNPSSHYIHHSRINLWPMLGKKTIRWERRQGEKKKRDCLLFHHLNEEYSIPRRKQLFILSNVLTTQLKAFFLKLPPPNLK